MHTLIMRVTFDPKKAARNLKKHSVSLADAALIFDGFYLTHEDDRERYAEQRFVSVGQAVNGVVVVIHTIVTDEHIHVISARRAEPYEARHYWKEYARYSSR